MTPIKILALVVPLALTAATAVSAATPPSMDQWRLVEGLTMRALIDDGFEVKAALIDDTTFYYDKAKFWTYTLQKGTELIECSERIQYVVVAEDISIVRSDLGCYELVAPFEVNEEGEGGSEAAPEQGESAAPPV